MSEMETALRDYLVDELALVESRKEELDAKIKRIIAQMNLELGKMEGIAISLGVRRNEILKALGVNVTEEQDEPEPQKE